LGERRITSERDIKKGVAALIASCAHMARVHALAGDPPLRRRPPGFEGLARVIAGQQLSVASAEAIWQRLQARVQPFAVAPFLAVPEDDLPEVAIHEQLTALKGIGPWTADIYILFCLGRPDAWSPGDLALQHAVRDALGLEARPEPKQMVDIAEAWRPWRSVAARLLWAYYAVRKSQRLATPL
jgi:DNA-3-methyladenine glycosylase II